MKYFVCHKASAEAPIWLLEELIGMSYGFQVNNPSYLTSENICPAPWMAMASHPDGSLRPCCVHSKKPEMQGPNHDQPLPLPSFAEIRKQMIAGEKPQGCQSCFKKNEAGLRSRRDFFLKRLSFLDDLGLKRRIAQPLNENDLLDLYYLDVAFSNKCNLRCRFCGPQNSTRWIPDAKKLLSGNFSNLWSQTLATTKEAFEDDVDRFIEIVKSSPNLKEIEIKGGEPFFSRRVDNFLERLVSISGSDKIRINITTNGTIIPHQLQQTLQHFKDVVITVSVDGTKSMYQYIRGERFSLEKDIQKFFIFFSKMRNVRLTCRFTLCAINAFSLADTYLWFLSLQKTTPNLERFELGYVNGPSCLRVELLPQSYKEEICRSMSGDLFMPLWHIFPLLKKQSLSSEEIRSERLRLVSYIKDLDQIRGEDILSVEPKFGPLMQDPFLET